MSLTSDVVACRAATRPAISPAVKNDIPEFVIRCGNTSLPIISGVRTIGSGTGEPCTTSITREKQDVRTANRRRSGDRIPRFILFRQFEGERSAHLYQLFGDVCSAARDRTRVPTFKWQSHEVSGRGSRYKHQILVTADSPLRTRVMTRKMSYKKAEGVETWCHLHKYPDRK